ncbi:MAG: hypothetical protein OEY16_04175, partial [Alphaproteobacteria bacterium]|nr:hypothetical protein [Alphaproteobacteria bacterium]
MNTRLKWGVPVLGLVATIAMSLPAQADKHSTLPDSMAKPGGFPERPLSMIVPYGPGGGSGQVARGMIEGVKDATG